MPRLALVVALSCAIFTSRPAFAHAIVDVGVKIHAAPFVASDAATISTIDVTDYAYDVATGVVLTVTFSDRFVSATGTGWNCSASGQSVTCSAETLQPGTSTVLLSTRAPATGSIQISANVVSIGTLDPNPSNDKTSATSAVYDPASCTAAPPQLLIADEVTTRDGNVTFAWSAVGGASQYRLWTAAEGAAATVTETTQTSVRTITEAGRTEWWVEAIFASCPSIVSNHEYVISTGGTIPFDVATLAGSTSGTEDGTLATARFRTPAAVGVDLDGNIYVIDSDASTLRKIAPDGTVSTPSGIADQPGADDGPAHFSTVNHPRALSVTPGGYVYVADTDNDTVRQFFPAGNGAFFGPWMTTLAGSPLAGRSARFNRPAAIAVASNGVILVADTGNGRVREIGPITTDVTTVTSAVGAPSGLAVADDGTIYLADAERDVILRLARDGNLTTLAGLSGAAGFADGVGSDARFDSPAALTLDPLGNLYVADTGNDAIRRIAPSGRVTTVVGRGTLAAPTGIAWMSPGHLLIADAGNHVIRIGTRRGTAAGAPARHRAVQH